MLTASAKLIKRAFPSAYSPQLIERERESKRE